MQHGSNRLPTQSEVPTAKESALELLRAREQRIDETLEESFPASDPPYWTLGNEQQEVAKR